MTGVTDWRGVEITPGATVIHGATSGYSVVATEARVADDPFTRTGKVRLVVIRRAGGRGAWHDTIVVEPRHVTVVGELPPSSVATTSDLRRALHEAMNRRAL